MDIQMPYLDGYQATKEIKKFRPALPIIVQTARAMEGDREKAILSGCDDYITKPLNPQNLLAKIQQFLTQDNFPTSAVTRSEEIEKLIPGIDQAHLES
jgi:CheY-like chemotaxis protein